MINSFEQIIKKRNTETTWFIPLLLCGLSIDVAIKVPDVSTTQRVVPR